MGRWGEEEKWGDGSCATPFFPPYFDIPPSVLGLFLLLSFFLVPRPPPPPHHIYSSLLLPGLPSNLCQPPIRLNPSVLYIVRPSQPFSPAFSLLHHLISSLQAAHLSFHIIFLRRRHRSWPFTPCATPQPQLPRSLPHPPCFISFITTLQHCCTPPCRVALRRWLILTFCRHGGEWR